MNFRTPILCGSLCSLAEDCIGFALQDGKICLKLRLNDFQEVQGDHSNAINVWIGERYLTKLRFCFRERKSYPTPAGAESPNLKVIYDSSPMGPYNCLKSCRETPECVFFDYNSGSGKCFRKKWMDGLTAKSSTTNVGGDPLECEQVDI